LIPILVFLLGCFGLSRPALAALTFPELASGQLGVVIKSESLEAMQLHPLALEIVDADGRASWLEGRYSKVISHENGQRAEGTLVTPNGSVFSITDDWDSPDNIFRVRRKVQVLAADPRDRGFATRLSLKSSVARPLHDYDTLVPAVWYGTNQDVAASALASDLSDQDYWFREDRLPLPFIMLRARLSGWTLTVMHEEVDGRTFKEEDGLARIIDERMQFGSIGLRDRADPAPGFTFPGSEGERTGVFGMQMLRRWALRSHPVKPWFEQNYTLTFQLARTSSFEEALHASWGLAQRRAAPKIYTVDHKTFHDGQIALLDRYWQEVNGAPGLPFRIGLDGNLPKPEDFNLNMGFVGQQLPNAFLLLREGLRRNNPRLVDRGKRMIDWWVANSLDSAGILKSAGLPSGNGNRSWGHYSARRHDSSGAGILSRHGSLKAAD
jgi:hypothetical protein